MSLNKIFSISIFKKGRIKNYILTHSDYLYFLMLYFVFNFFFINKFFPITEGWFQDYARYMMEGQFPYRDFYVPVPPGFIYLVKLLRSFFGDIFIYYRIYGLLERMVLVSLVFFMFKRLFSGKVLFIAVFTGSVMYIANLQDIFYSYYQTSFLFAILVLYSIICMFEQYNYKDVYFWSFVYGSCSACSFLFKQTIGSLLPIALGFIFIMVTFRRNLKKTLICCGISTTSAIVILGLVAYVLSVNNALIPCIEQIFLGAQSKGSFQNIFFGFISRMITEASVIFILIYLTIIICFYVYQRYSFEPIKILCMSLISILGFAIVTFSFVLPLMRESDNRVVILLCFLLFTILTLSSYLYNLYNNKHKSLLLFGIVFVTLFVFLLFIKPEIFTEWCFNAIGIRQSIIPSVFLISFLWWIYEFYDLSRFGFRLSYNTNIKAIKLFVLSASFVIMYTHSLSYIVEEHGTLLIAVLLLGQLLSAHVVNLKFEFLLKSITVLYCFLSIFIIFVQKSSFPYYWWGVNTLPPISKSKCLYQDPNLIHFYGDQLSVTEMNKIYSFIEKNKRFDDKLYTFPHINYFNVMSSLDSPTFAKVHYFDVCPDFVVEKDLKKKKKTPPKFVLIQTLEEWEWKFHEKVFRSGRKSAQRKIIEYYKSQIDNDNYKLIKKFRIGNSDEILLLMLNS